jgi:hypothetical protein
MTHRLLTPHTVVLSMTHVVWKALSPMGLSATVGRPTASDLSKEGVTPLF